MRLEVPMARPQEFTPIAVPLLNPMMQASFPQAELAGPADEELFS